METNTLELDCREMQPPEPMIAVLTALPTLQTGQRIKMLHRMIPRPLFEKLEEKGFLYQVEEYQTEQNTTEYIIWIWKEDSCTKD